MCKGKKEGREEDKGCGGLKYWVSLAKESEKMGVMFEDGDQSRSIGQFKYRI